MEIKKDEGNVTYDASSATIAFRGIFRLRGSDGYADIIRLLDDLAEQKPKTITLRLQELETMNSSGVKALCQFVLKVKTLKTSKLIIMGTHQVTWQIRTLSNLKQLMPELILKIE